MTDYTRLLPIAHQAADLAHTIMRTHQPGTITVKGDRDMATDVDYAIERQLREFLTAQTPTIGILGEEEGVSGANGGLTWAIDPVDGTVNYIHGSPLCGISIGLLDDDQAVLGVIDLPFLGTRYSAVQHNGAHANGTPIRVSAVDRLDQAVIAIGDYAVGAGAEQKNAARFALTQQLAPAVQRIRMHGSAAIDLAWLAHGKIDAIAMLSNRPWDTTAGVAIAREAGAHLTDHDGALHTQQSDATIGASPPLLNEILNLIQI